MNLHKYVPYDLLLLLGLSKIKYCKQFTSWNIILSILQPLLNISPSSLFINSLTTWCGFQYGAPYYVKLRLMNKNKIKSVPQFIILDILAHFTPVLWWGYVLLSKKRYISNINILRQSIWVAMYYTIVGKGLNCERQYVKYPYHRQVFQAVSTPIIGKYVFNKLIDGNIYPLVLYLSYLYYGKDYLELCDTVKNPPEDKDNEKKIVTTI